MKLNSKQKQMIKKYSKNKWKHDREFWKYLFCREDLKKFSETISLFQKYQNDFIEKNTFKSIVKILEITFELYKNKEELKVMLNKIKVFNLINEFNKNLKERASLEKQINYFGW